MNIQITITDENLDFSTELVSSSFESATEDLGKLERRYNRRVQMELDKADVHGEASKEEQF